MRPAGRAPSLGFEKQKQSGRPFFRMAVTGLPFPPGLIGQDAKRKGGKSPRSCRKDFATKRSLLRTLNISVDSVGVLANGRAPVAGKMLAGGISCSVARESGRVPPIPHSLGVLSRVQEVSSRKARQLCRFFRGGRFY